MSKSNLENLQAEIADLRTCAKIHQGEKLVMQSNQANDQKQIAALERDNASLETIKGDLQALDRCNYSKIEELKAKNDTQRETIRGLGTALATCEEESKGAQELRERISGLCDIIEYLEKKIEESRDTIAERNKIIDMKQKRMNELKSVGVSQLRDIEQKDKKILAQEKEMTKRYNQIHTR